MPEGYSAESDESKQPHPIDVLVGVRVREARLARGMTQAALADQIGVSFQQVQKYENGSNRISASKLVEIADTLLVSPAGFLEGLGAAPSSEPRSATALPGAHDLLTNYARLAAPFRKMVAQLASSLVEATVRGEASSFSAAGRDADGLTSQ